MQERRNSIALAMELRLSCINPSIAQTIVSTLYFNFDYIASLGHKLAKAMTALLLWHVQNWDLIGT